MPPMTQQSQRRAKGRRYVCHECRKVHKQCPHTDPSTAQETSTVRLRKIIPRSRVPSSKEVASDSITARSPDVPPHDAPLQKTSPEVDAFGPFVTAPAGITPEMCRSTVFEFIDDSKPHAQFWWDNYPRLQRNSKALCHATFGLCLFHRFETRQVEAFEQIEIAARCLQDDIASRDTRRMESGILAAGTLGFSHFCNGESLAGFTLHIRGVVSMLEALEKNLQASSSVKNDGTVKDKGNGDGDGDGDRHTDREAGKNQDEGAFLRHIRVPPAVHVITSSDVSPYWLYLSPFFDQFPGIDMLAPEYGIGDIQDLLALVIETCRCIFDTDAASRRRRSLRNVRHLSRIMPGQYHRTHDKPSFTRVFEQSVHAVSYMCVYPHRQLSVTGLCEVRESIRVAELAYGALMFPRLVMGWHARHEKGQI